MSKPHFLPSTSLSELDHSSAVALTAVNSGTLGLGNSLLFGQQWQPTSLLRSSAQRLGARVSGAINSDLTPRRIMAVILQGHTECPQSNSHLDPACGTCRKKCRKCDRKRPICDRCRTKGLHCEGYPPRFQFCEMMTIPLARRGSSSTRRDSVALSSTPSFPISGESPSGSSSAAVPEAVTTASVTDSASPQASLSPDQGLPDSTILSLPSPASVSHSPFTPVHIDSTSPLIGTPDLSQDIISNRPLIDYCKGLKGVHWAAADCSLSRPDTQ